MYLLSWIQCEGSRNSREQRDAGSSVGPSQDPTALGTRRVTVLAWPVIAASFQVRLAPLWLEWEQAMPQKTPTWAVGAGAGGGQRGGASSGMGIAILQLTRAG